MDLFIILFFALIIGILIKLNKIINRLDIITKQNEVLIRQNQDFLPLVKEIDSKVEK